MINDDSYVVFNNSPLARRADGGVLANDSDPDGGLFIVVDEAVYTTTQGGEIAMQADGSFVYLAPSGFFGTDTFIYTAEDSVGSQASATIRFEVAPGANQPAIRMADESLTGAVLADGQAQIPLPELSFPNAPVALSGGGYVIAGLCQMGSSDNYIFAQAYDAGGNVVGSLFEVHAANGVHDVAAVATSDGYVLAWREGGATSDEWPVEVQVFDQAGNPAGATIELFAGAELSGPPEILKLADGNLAVVVNEIGVGAVAQIVAPDGDLVGPSFTLEGPPIGDAGPIATIADDLGGFLQLWREVTLGESRLFVQRLAADGTPTGPEIDVVDGIEESLSAGLVVSPDGGLIVSWVEYGNSPSVANVHARVIAPDGTPTGTEFVSADFFSASLFGAPNQRAFALTDGFVVAWERDVEPFGINNGGEVGGETRAISAVVFDASGNVISDEILVYTVQSQTPLGAGRFPPRVVALDDGGFAIAAHQFVDGVEPDMNVVLHSFDRFGNRTGSETLINGSAAEYQLYPAVALLRDGRVVGAWTGGTDTEAYVGSQILDMVDVVQREEDQGPITLPLAVDIVRSFGPDSAVRIVIEGLPEGSALAPPAGMTANFDPGTGHWTLTGTIPDAFNLILTLPQYFWGEFTMLATVHARDDVGTVEVASTPLAVRFAIAPDAAVIIGTPGDDTVNGTVSVAGQDYAGPLGDVIRGLAGRDILSGLEGDDLIDGGGGGDRMSGDDGNDMLLGYRGRDTLLGGDDNESSPAAGTATPSTAAPATIGSTADAARICSPAAKALTPSSSATPASRTGSPTSAPATSSRSTARRLPA